MHYRECNSVASLIRRSRGALEPLSKPTLSIVHLSLEFLSYIVLLKKIESKNISRE